MRTAITAIAAIMWIAVVITLVTYKDRRDPVLQTLARVSAVVIAVGGVAVFVVNFNPAP